MADRLELEVVTPEKLVLRENVDEVVVPGLGGELGILPDHTPLISQLQSGVLTYRKGTEKKSLHVSGGFVEVLPDRVAVLAEVAETPEEIDFHRAQEARARAEKLLAASLQGASTGDETDLEIIKEKLQRAITRMELAKK
ncbi:MAG: F0F1 ATP synthase subunit epsilon [Acidobacteriota bacterium]